MSYNNIYLGALFVLVLGTSACGGTAGPEMRAGGALDAIVDGSNVSSADDLGKSVVALITEHTDGATICTGSILDEETILTAAHCFEEGLDRTVIVFGPRTKNPRAGFTREADNFTQHPRFSKPTRDGRGDVAVVHFAGGLPAGFHPVVLAPTDSALVEGTEVKMLGYGVSSGLLHLGSGRLRQTVTTIQKEFSKTEIVTDGLESSICFGDSGGPAFLELDGKFVQWGIASMVSSPFCRGTSLHTSVLTYETWIRSASTHLAKHHPKE